MTGMGYFSPAIGTWQGPREPLKEKPRRKPAGCARPAAARTRSVYGRNLI